MGSPALWAVSQGTKCSLYTTFIKPFNFVSPTAFSFRGPQSLLELCDLLLVALHLQVLAF